ncbi:hypothetical protein [Kineococcus rhizosphaerae]|uniref:Uncharacterized protein n=1 Tax=Kineococcus rhizosphaerae TaxID=559628 RepID=A0A2T0R4V8_9ACTN|nr:hypothetical protein [Kineococcus rhizosphaerae]PRY15796.1 hypothetical protein CLV37_1045 [Kineococcus rhizosphaerae]
MQDWGGYSLKDGEPDYTPDDQFWDGTRVYSLTHDDVRKRQGRLLHEAEVMVLNLLDCTPHSPRLGSKHLLTQSQRRQIAEAGTVRFVEPEGCLQRWQSSDGTVLALLVGEVRSPRLH